jgi:flagellar L-ring protein precursor FlgH
MNWHSILLVAIGAIVITLLFGVPAAHAQSLYHETTFQALTADRKAHRVGDLLTVLIQENASATSSTDTATGRNNNVGGHVDSPFHTKWIVGTHAGAIGTNSDFQGTGKTERAGTLLAQMSLTVQEVLPNGDLVVEGEQSVEINNERQRIHVRGRARPEDINELNAIASFRLADADISYQGAGDLAKTQRPSWWVRLLSAFGF